MASSRRDQWVNAPLNQFLLKIFPKYRTVLGHFDVARLGNSLNLSNESIYKWLRKSGEGKRCLSPTNAQRILELALEPDNVELLIASDTPRPEIRDFDIFVYG